MAEAVLMLLLSTLHQLVVAANPATVGLYHKLPTISIKPAIIETLLSKLNFAHIIKVLKKGFILPLII